MTKQLLGVDPMTGTAQFSHYDDSDDIFRYHQEVETAPLVAINRRDYANAPMRYGGDMHLVARLPMVLWLKLYQDGTLNDPPRLKRWLNDPDHRDFRTRPGWV